MLHFADGSPFSTGRMSCQIRPIPGAGENINRLLVTISVDEVPAQAVVDTGGVYLILEPNLAGELELDPGAAVGEATLNIRGRRFPGALYRLTLHLPAEHGDSLTREVTAFIPKATPEEWGDIPTFLGLTGCLEFLRFAVDPMANQFYFAST